MGGAGEGKEEQRSPVKEVEDWETGRNGFEGAGCEGQTEMEPHGGGGSWLLALSRRNNGVGKDVVSSIDINLVMDVMRIRPESNHVTML